jgi:hypothetical protein
MTMTEAQATPFPPEGCWALGRRLWRAVQRNRILLVAAGVTFYLLPALFPALVAFLSVYGLFLNPATAAEQAAAFRGLVPAAGSDLIATQPQRLAAPNRPSVRAVAFGRHRAAGGRGERPDRTGAPRNEARLPQGAPTCGLLRISIPVRRDFRVKLPKWRVWMPVDRHIITDRQRAKIEPHCLCQKSDPGRTGATFREPAGSLRAFGCIARDGAGGP